MTPTLRALRFSFLAAVLLAGSFPLAAGPVKAAPKVPPAGLVFESTLTTDECVCDKDQTSSFDSQTFRVKGKTADDVTQCNPAVDRFVDGVMDSLGFRRFVTKTEFTPALLPVFAGEKGNSHFLFVAKDDDATKAGMAKVTFLGTKAKGAVKANIRKLFVILLDKDFKKVGDEIRWNFKVLVSFDGEWRYGKGAASKVGWEGVMDSSRLRNEVLSALKGIPSGSGASSPRRNSHQPCFIYTSPASGVRRKQGNSHFLFVAKFQEEA
jgi:hypothetical protein